MDVVAIVAQKGGTGKTTLAVSLAVVAEQSGRTAAVVDLDPQASATRWSDRRSADTPVVVSAQASRLGHVIDGAEEQGADFLVIDTPPRAEQAALAAARAAQLVMIPCRPSIYDLETVATTIELVRYAGDRPTIVVLNGVPPRGPKREQAVQVIESMNLMVCPVSFGERVAFDHASSSGQSAQEYDPGGKAANEIKQVYEFTTSIFYSAIKKGE